MKSENIEFPCLCLYVRDAQNEDEAVKGTLVPVIVKATTPICSENSLSVVLD